MGVLATLAVVVPFTVGSVLTVSSAPAASSSVVLTFRDSRIVESSGLATRGGRFVTVNDSGDSGRIFTVETDGRTVGTTSWGSATDIEAVAPWRSGKVLVGDIGDNGARRSSVKLMAVPVMRGDRRVSAPTFTVTYPGGAQDAEALLVHPTSFRVLVITKNVAGGDVLSTRGLELSSRGTNRFQRLGSVIPVVTDGAFLPDGRHLVVRDYQRAVFYRWPSLRRVATVELPDQPQGEGIAVNPNGTLFVSTEGAQSELRKVNLPASVRRALAPSSRPAESPAATPTSATPAAPTDATTTDVPREVESERPVWPWAAGGVVGLAAIAVLVRSLRQR